MVNNRQRNAIRKSEASAEDQAQHDRIRNLLNTLAPLDSAATPPGQNSNTASHPSTSNNSRKRRISAVRRRPFNWRPKRKAKASAVRANNTDSEVVANPSSQPSTSGTAPNGPRDRQAQNNNPPGIVTQQLVQIDNSTPKKSVKPKKPIKKEPENLDPEQMDAEFEYVNMDIAIHQGSNQEQPDPESDNRNVVPPQSQQPVAPPTPSAADIAAATASKVMVPRAAIDVAIPPLASEAAAARPQRSVPLVFSAQQDQASAPAAPTPVDQVAVTPVVRLDRPQCPEYLNTERAALIRLSGRPNDFRTWNAQDVHDWLGMLPNQSAAFKALREKLLEYDGSGDFLNQLLSGPESVKSASEMLNASILHCHSIKRHVAALENSLLEAEYKEAMQKYEKQNN
ncbi:hypothetical protein B9Z55_004900 [Caenorhabditis nigoni]|uniref:Uncharacterized protein n=1 Tax=Caenorhabditis nigoni TaxID=1611254 RepID=A0A2G5UYJ7_9PELO|nr:hypothetical protein B9Z55_004900 [Caenorhabditis nigoni]